MSASITDKCRQAREISGHLANLEGEEKNLILQKIAQKIKHSKKDIAQANALDVQAGEALVEAGELSKALLSRLVLNENKIDQLVVYLEEVSKLEDPVGSTQYAMQLDQDLELTRVSCPIGVLAVLFESRPEVVIQVSALSLKSGNAVILKGGSEASNSNRMLFSLIHQVLVEENLEGAVGLIETRDDVAAILVEEDYIDLIIPRGSNEFVRYIQDHSRIPVLGHSEGICNLYIDENAKPEMAASLAVDSKVDYPSACNAVENILFDQKCADTLIRSVLEALQGAKVLLKVSADLQARVPDMTLLLADEEDFRTEYSDMVVSLGLVEDLNRAIAWINKKGSHHTDSIVTEDMRNAELFLTKVNSACTFHNCSTRFSDGYVFGLGAEVGVSTNKTHARGPVGLEGLVIYKYLLKGKGQIKGAYSGSGAKPFLHLPLPY